MNFDFPQNVLRQDSHIFNLDDIRNFLLDTKPTICNNFQIGSHIKSGKRVFVYDWEALLNTMGVDEVLSSHNLINNGIKPIKQ